MKITNDIQMAIAVQRDFHALHLAAKNVADAISALRRVSFEDSLTSEEITDLQRCETTVSAVFARTTHNHAIEYLKTL